jgi:hypothetical protein
MNGNYPDYLEISISTTSTLLPAVNKVVETSAPLFLKIGNATSIAVADMDPP